MSTVTQSITILHITTKDSEGCEFVIASVLMSDDEHWYEVSCWKGKDYEDCHWCKEFKDKDKAVAEFNRWAGEGAYVG